VRDHFEFEDVHFKWLILMEDRNSPRCRRLSIKRVESIHEGKINLEKYTHKNAHKNHFVFIDLESALKALVGKRSACLFLPSSELQRVKDCFQELEKFQFICFDKGEANQAFFKFIEQKKKEKQGATEPQPSATQEQEKQFEDITIEKVVEELECCTSTDSNVDTTYISYSKT
jgi:hypothetical protein